MPEVAEDLTVRCGRQAQELRYALSTGLALAPED
jgi:hypothetical protein